MSQKRFVFKDEYDVIVIGGGINGAGIAHLAAQEGLSVALLEKGDFASGTSSKSTKLIHGGLRYLEQFRFKHVKEALAERHLLLQTAPHLVHPLRFIVPGYAEDARSLWMIRLGVMLYDWFSGPYSIKPHRSLKLADVFQSVPDLRRPGLRGAISYWDAQMDDARLCLESVLQARAYGADVLNYCKVTSLRGKDGQVAGVAATDEISKQRYEIRAKQVVCATGPWTDAIKEMDPLPPEERVRPTKGVHIVYGHRFSDDALLLTARRDNRVFFVIPWHGHSLIGTTDTDHRGSPDDVQVTEADIEYLLKECQRVFPQHVMDRDKIIHAFAGLRPLVYAETDSPSRVSREHDIVTSGSGMVYVMGGKYTTFRKIAEDTLTHLGIERKTGAGDFRVFGSAGGRLRDPVDETVVDQATLKHLKGFYGAAYVDVLRLVTDDAALSAKLCEGLPVILAQVVYAMTVEFAQTPEDVIERRLSLIYEDIDRERLLEEVQQVMTRYGSLLSGEKEESL